MKRLVPLAAFASAALLLTGCSSGGGAQGGAASTTGAADAQTVTVGMTDKLAFTPSTVNAKVGTVTFEVSNTGKIPHNLHFEDDGLGKTGTINGDEKEPLKVAFAKAGTFTFVCTFHSGMTGKVVVS